MIEAIVLIIIVLLFKLMFVIAGKDDELQNVRREFRLKNDELERRTQDQQSLYDKYAKLVKEFSSLEEKYHKLLVEDQLELSEKRRAALKVAPSYSKVPQTNQEMANMFSDMARKYR